MCKTNKLLLVFFFCYSFAWNESPLKLIYGPHDDLLKFAESSSELKTMNFKEIFP
jgi:hypothetical protein